MKLIVHAKSGDERVKAYLATRTDATSCDAVKYDGTPVPCGEVVISAELPNVDAICAAYKAEGIKVTTLSKHVEPPKPKAE